MVNCWQVSGCGFFVGIYTWVEGNFWLSFSQVDKEKEWKKTKVHCVLVLLFAMKIHNLIRTICITDLPFDLQSGAVKVYLITLYVVHPLRVISNSHN